MMATDDALTPCMDTTCLYVFAEIKHIIDRLDGYCKLCPTLRKMIGRN